MENFMIFDHLDVNFSPDINVISGETSPVYIPPKEIISATENFGSLYSDYHIAFEETYYDLTHNAVMEEFDSLYDREQERLYGRN